MRILRLSHGESAGGGDRLEPEDRAAASEDPESEPESSPAADGPDYAVDQLWENDEQTMVVGPPLEVLEKQLRLVADRQTEKPVATVPMPWSEVGRREEAQPAAHVQSGSIYQEPYAQEPYADPDDQTIFDGEIDTALARFSELEDASDGPAQPSVEVGVDLGIPVEQRVDNAGGSIAYDRLDAAAGELELPPPRPPRQLTGHPFALAPPLPPRQQVPMDPGAPGAGWPGGVPPGYPHAYYSVPTGPVPFSTATGRMPTVTGQYTSVTGQFPSVTGQFPSVTGSIPYIVQPVVAGPGLRWLLGLAVVLVVTTTVGVGLGWLLFARPGLNAADDTRPGAAEPARAAITAAPAIQATQPSAPAAPAAATPGSPQPSASAPAATTPPAAVSAAAPAPAAESKASAPPAAEPVVVEIISLAHPHLTTMTAPMRGEIAFSSVHAARRVRKGDKLFQIRRKRPARSDKAELARRVTELERLAKEDPAVYEAFLARARDDAAKAQRGGDITSTVRAAVEGLAEPRVGRGARVRQGDALAVISNPDLWTVKASLRGAKPTREWSCAITPADGGSRAPCRIEKVSITSAGAKVSASVETGQVPWLRRADQKPRLVLEPPPAR